MKLGRFASIAAGIRMRQGKRDCEPVASLNSICQKKQGADLVTKIHFGYATVLWDEIMRPLISATLHKHYGGLADLATANTRRKPA
jgi:hypothetical protein